MTRINIKKTVVMLSVTLGVGFSIFKFSPHFSFSLNNQNDGIQQAGIVNNATQNNYPVERADPDEVLNRIKEREQVETFRDSDLGKSFMRIRNPAVCAFVLQHAPRVDTIRITAFGDYSIGASLPQVRGNVVSYNPSAGMLMSPESKITYTISYQPDDTYTGKMFTLGDLVYEKRPGGGVLQFKK